MNSSRLQVTPLILTYNEAPNLRRTLERLAWAMEIVIVDSFSTDETLAILREFPQVRVVQRKFDTFAGQCNFGLAQITTEWVLSLDADYVLSEEMVAEIKGLDTGESLDGYTARFKYCIFGRPLRSTLYPPRTVLYRRERALYHNVGHGHRVQLPGKVRMLNGFIFHDDRKSLGRWFGEQTKYSDNEAHYLTQTDSAQLNFADRIRKKILFAPVLVFFHTLLVKGLILDGWPGWFYVFQRTFAEILLSLRLMEEKLAATRGKKETTI